ncbi:MAG: hypothetical protein AB8B63_09540 [Granulosicoccus sp.]
MSSCISNSEVLYGSEEGPAWVNGQVYSPQTPVQAEFVGDY